jgi:hypothetical protein
MWILLLVLLLLAALAAWVWYHTPDQTAKRQSEIQDQIYIYGNACNTLLATRGITPRKGETPLRFARRLDKQHLVPAPVLPLWRSLALANYSRLKPGEKQLEAAKTTWQALYKPQSLWIKLRFLLKAAFGKNCYRSLETRLEHQEPASPFGKYKDSIRNAAGKSRGKKTAASKAATKIDSPKHKPIVPAPSEPVLPPAVDPKPTAPENAAPTKAEPVAGSPAGEPVENRSSEPQTPSEMPRRRRRSPQ